MGGVPVERIESIFGSVDVHTRPEGGETPRSPGQKYAHYAPAVPLMLFFEGAEAELKAEYEKRRADGEKPVVLALEAARAAFSGLEFLSLGEYDSFAAQRLFAAFRDAEKKYSCILALALPESGLGRTVNARLQKAAGIGE